MIHTAVHEARPEVNAVVHSHATMSKAWCSLNAPLPLLSQDSCAFYNSLGVDDQFGGIALDPDEGKRIASVLGDKPCALLGVRTEVLSQLLSFAQVPPSPEPWFYYMRQVRRIGYLLFPQVGKGV